MYQPAIQPLDLIQERFDMICLVDDDPGSIFLHTHFLHEIGYIGTLKKFNYPLEALDKIKNLSDQHSILLLLDVNMPLCTGWQFVDQICTDWSGAHQNNLTIGVLSSSVHPSDRERAKANPLVTLYSEKPIDVLGMSSILDQLVEAF